MQPTREDAWELLTEHTKRENLIKHALAVEAAMRFYARKYGADEELWGVTGLIHDFDYEEHPSPEEHPSVGARILEEKGWPEEIIEAVKGHAPYLGVPRKTKMAQALFAVDELTGLIVACTLVRPSKSLFDLEVESVLKKWDSNSFAAGVNRSDIEQGTEELGVEMEEHIALVIEAMRSVADDLELAGK